MTNTFTPKNNYKNCSFCSLAYTVSLLQCRPSIHLKTFSMITAIKMRKEEWERTISTGTSSRRKGTRRKYSALTRSDVLCRHSEKTKQIQKNTEKMCQSLNKKKRSKKTARDGQNKEKGRGIWRKIITGADEEERETKRLTLFKPSHTHTPAHTSWFWPLTSPLWLAAGSSSPVWVACSSRQVGFHHALCLDSGLLPDVEPQQRCRWRNLSTVRPGPQKSDLLSAGFVRLCCPMIRTLQCISTECFSYICSCVIYALCFVMLQNIQYILAAAQSVHIFIMLFVNKIYSICFDVLSTHKLCPISASKQELYLQGYHYFHM